MPSLSILVMVDEEVASGMVDVTEVTVPESLIVMSKNTMPPPFSLSCTTA